jgi:hypothetical protein
MKSLLQKIDLRLIVRVFTIAMLGMQIALAVIFLSAGLMTQASSAFTLCIWMFLALLFESKAYNLKDEKESLVKFLNMKFLNAPPVESEGGEA